MDSDYILTSDGQLYHWGIKGMKWGVRRFQNKDGSLTAKGRKRYNDEAEKLKERERVIKNKERVKAKQDKLAAKKAELDARDKALKDAEDAAKPKKEKTVKNKAAADKKKSIADMTDDELQKLINRARLEDQYKQLRPEPTPRKNKMLSALEPVLIDAGKNLAKNALDKIGKDLMKDKVDKNSLKYLEEQYKKLDYKNKIRKLSNDDDTDDGDMTWDERTKKQQYEWNEYLHERQREENARADRKREKEEEEDD